MNQTCVEPLRSVHKSNKVTHPSNVPISQFHCHFSPVFGGNVRLVRRSTRSEMQWAGFFKGGGELREGGRAQLCLLFGSYVTGTWRLESNSLIAWTVLHKCRVRAGEDEAALPECSIRLHRGKFARPEHWLYQPLHVQKRFWLTSIFEPLLSSQIRLNKPTSKSYLLVKSPSHYWLNS